MPTARPRRSIAIQGVEVQVRFGIRDVQALVPGKVLEFGLHSATGAEAWLKTCRQREAAIEVAVHRRFAARSQEVVVLRTTDFDTRRQ